MRVGVSSSEGLSSPSSRVAAGSALVALASSLAGVTSVFPGALPPIPVAEGVDAVAPPEVCRVFLAAIAFDGLKQRLEVIAEPRVDRLHSQA